MAIPTVVLPRGDNHVSVEEKRNAQIVCLPFQGNIFRVRALELSRERFRSFGLDQRYYKPGVKIYLLTQTEYERFSNICGVSEVDGFYSKGRIVLPEEYQESTLVHEVLHDVYANLPVESRAEFARNILFWYRLSIDPNYPQHHRNRSFYEKMAGDCKEKYDIEKIRPFYAFQRELNDPAFYIFAGECFAYAGERVLFQQEKVLGHVPHEIYHFLRFNFKLFNPRVFSQASAIAIAIWWSP